MRERPPTDTAGGPQQQVGGRGGTATVVYTHPVCRDHEMGADHPESPGRLTAILRALEGGHFDLLDRREAPRAPIADLVRVHAPFYVEAILENVPEEGYVRLDPDTAMNPASGEAALRAAGGICAAVDAVVTGQARNAFCAVRPPGHHAEAERAMGFCLFNNIAIAAEYARHVHGIERVAVADFDVHHGNGTQSHFYRYRHLFYASSHQWPLFPGTGRENETGVFGNICNVCLSPGAGSEQFREAWSKRILPALDRFAPDLLLISAGFDAHFRDPLAQLRLQTEDFGWVTGEILEIADKRCHGRVVSTLEGGYDLHALAGSAALHVETLMAC